MLWALLVHLSDGLHGVLQRFELHQVLIILVERSILVVLERLLRELVGKHVRFLSIALRESAGEKLGWYFESEAGALILLLCVLYLCLWLVMRLCNLYCLCILLELLHCDVLTVGESRTL